MELQILIFFVISYWTGAILDEVQIFHIGQVQFHEIQKLQQQHKKVTLILNLT